MIRTIAVALTCTALLPSQSNSATGSLSVRTRRDCSPGMVCFTGEVSAGKQFRHPINGNIEFVLEPASDQDSGWTIQVKPLQVTPNCDEFAGVVSLPLRFHSSLAIDMSYGFSAEEEVAASPREFGFVTNCKDLKAETRNREILLWQYTHTSKQVKIAYAEMGASPQGTGHLWITGSRITHLPGSSESQSGSVEWIRFMVAIKLPGPAGHRGHSRPAPAGK